MNNFADDQGVIARLVDVPHLAFSISEGVPENGSAGVLFEMADFGEFVTGGLRGAFERANDLALLFCPAGLARILSRRRCHQHGLPRVSAPEAPDGGFRQTGGHAIRQTRDRRYA